MFHLRREVIINDGLIGKLIPKGWVVFGFKLLCYVKYLVNRIKSMC